MRRLSYIIFAALIIVLSAPLHTYAEIGIIKINETSILLQGKNCDELVLETQNILKWKKRLNEAPLNQPSCQCIDNKCEIDIYGILPDLARTWHDLPSSIFSGNCWNTALVQSKILPYLRESSPEEITYFLQSPICKEKAINEVIEPGDYIVFREVVDSNKKISQELHIATYISENLIFQKPGVGAGEPIEITKFKYAKSLITFDRCYHLFKGIFQYPELANKCKRYTQIYSCTPETGNLDHNLSDIDKIEEKLSHWITAPLSLAINHDFSQTQEKLQHIIQNEQSIYPNTIIIRAKASLDYIKYIEYERRSLLERASLEAPYLSADVWAKLHIERIFNWYKTTKINQLEVLFDLKDFIKIHHRLPQNNSNTPNEIDLYSRLTSLQLLDKIQANPEYFSFFLDTI